jgi:hypothetical protein
MNILSRQRGEKPHGIVEQIGVGIIHAAVLFSSHGMPSQESLVRAFPKNLQSLLGDG